MSCNPVMSLSDADKIPEFASRITYEAREDLAKDEEANQLPRAIFTDEEQRASRTCAYVARMMKRNILRLGA